MASGCNPKQLCCLTYLASPFISCLLVPSQFGSKMSSHMPFVSTFLSPSFLLFLLFLSLLLFTPFVPHPQIYSSSGAAYNLWLPTQFTWSKLEPFYCCAHTAFTLEIVYDDLHSMVVLCMLVWHMREDLWSTAARMDIQAIGLSDYKR